MNDNLDASNAAPREPAINLPATWFESRISLEQIRHCFAAGREEIRIASGFFTIKGWGLIRDTTEGKRVYLLVGIDEPGEDRARAALVKEIMQELATGLDRGRRKSVEDLVATIESGALWIMDARATSHHGKLYIVDRTVAIVASANTTGRGFLEQKEAGGLYGPSLIDRFLEEFANSPEVTITPVVIEALHRFIQTQVANYIYKFDEYFALAKDITQELLHALQKWLELASPWDIYLKSLLAFEALKPVKSNYSKRPVSYQQDMIAQTLHQLREHEGAMLVASTGLGKTVVGVHVAIHLKAEDLIERVIVICPKAVQSTWKREMNDADLLTYYFNLHVLDKEDSDQAHALEEWETIIQSLPTRRYLLILDESHQLRKRYPAEFGNRKSQPEDRRERKAFTRIKQLVESGRVKVLLLSGSPYATDIDNVNTQLSLLPQKLESSILFPQFTNQIGAWLLHEADEFTDLPVTSQLTTPHVAKYYGQTDSQGIYIELDGDRKYIPNVILSSVYVPLPFEADLIPVIVRKYFELNLANSSYRKNIETLIKIAWSSSPLSIRLMLERTVDTPGGPKEFDFAKKQTSEFVWSLPERQSALNPLIEKFRSLTLAQDLKLQALAHLLRIHCPNEKVIVFCERHATAFYLEKALKKLMPSLKVFSTISKFNNSKNVEDEYAPKNLKEIERAIEKFAPVANNAVGKYRDTYEVFIATDAYGIGVNMQDASVVVNYDMAWTPIEPVQRAGRILRLWQTPRTVQIYTFIPTLAQQTELQEELLKIQQRWKNLMKRHGESKKLIDLPVLTDSRIQEIYMPDVASQRVVMESGNLQLDAMDEQEVSSYFKHTAQLQKNREYAQTIGSDISSALTYPGKNPLHYVLLKHNDKYHGVLYDLRTRTVRAPEPEKILDLIQCTQETEIPWVDAELIEEFSDACIQAWCAQQNVNEQEVVRECALYLKPESEADSMSDWLNQT